MAEKFTLKWNNFEANVSKSWCHLRNEDYLHDVTVVCDDNKQISAHKLVLSACSEFFKTLFKNYKHQALLICLEGISSNELQCILDYMYNGETNIFQEDLDRFLANARRFKIMGMLQKEESDTECDIPTASEDRDVDFDSYEMKTPMHKNTSWATSLKDDNVSKINRQVDELIETLPDGSYKCTLCGRERKESRRDMRYHAETHLDGFSFDCQLCGKTFRSRNSIKSHRSIYHKKGKNV